MNLETTIKDYNRGKKQKFLFFWGHQSTGEFTSKTCLSQWYETNFVVDGIIYPTAEHWMMAQKAELFKDHRIYKRIINCLKPGEAKELGRQIRNFDQKVWDQNKFQIVVEGNYYKFSENEPIKNFLIHTNERILVEASPVDPIWGIGMAKDHPNISDPNHWNGQNLLGFALMEAREMLMNSARK